MAHELTAYAPTGLTLTANLVQGATAVVTGIAITERTPSGFYTGDVPGGTAAGVYTVLLLSSGALIGSGTLRWDGSAEVLTAAVADVTTVGGAVAALPSASAITSAVWAAAARTLTAQSDSSGITTLLSRVTGAVLLASGYTAPDNASITAIKAKTDNLPAVPASQSDVTTVGTAVAGLQTTATAIKAKTDNLPASPAAAGDIPSTSAIRTALESPPLQADIRKVNNVTITGNGEDGTPWGPV